MAICLAILHTKKKLLVSFAPFIILLAAFVAFVRWNGSMVLGTSHSYSVFNISSCEVPLLLSLLLFSHTPGAKEAHVVSPHFAQILYFGLFSALLTAPLYFSFGQAVTFFCSFWKKKPHSFFQALLALIASFISVHFFRLVSS